MAFARAPGALSVAPSGLDPRRCATASQFAPRALRNLQRRRARWGVAMARLAETARQGGSGGDATDAKLVHRVASYCVADELRMVPFYRRLCHEMPASEDCTLSPTGANVLVISLTKCRAFCFSYGCIVVWGSHPDGEEDILRLAAADAVVPRAVPVVEALEWTYGAGGGIAGDRVTLESKPDTEDCVLEQLAISFALSQSIKLQAFEIAIRDTIESTRYLPEEMARKGRISARRSEIAAALGRLFLHRYAFNLSSDVVNTPHFFWENEEYLATYRRAERYMELGQRTTRHNAQLNALQDLLELLATSESTSSRIAFLSVAHDFRALGLLGILTVTWMCIFCFAGFLPSCTNRSDNRHASELELAILLLIAIEIALTLTSMAKQGLSVLLTSLTPIMIALVVLGIVYKISRRERVSRAKSLISVDTLP